MRCEATTRDGGQCRASALTGERRCLLHGNAGAARQLGAKGGRRRAIRASRLKKLATPQTASDVKKHLGQLVQDLRCGDVDARTGNAIVYALGTMLKAIEATELEIRVARLEQALSRNGVSQ
jgi:hypothetical protein